MTGTNGKTTIAYQLAQAHALLGVKSTYIGTIGQGDVMALQSLVNTTPDALCLQQLFHSYVQSAVQQVCIEVSSHALSQERVDCIDFQQAIFTNLSHEHLDYHHNMDDYAARKPSYLLSQHSKWAIINQDDAYSQFMQRTTNSCQTITYGINQEAQVRALNWEISLKGTRVELISPWGQQQLLIKALGFFNIYNALAVFTSLLAFGYPLKQVVSVIEKLQPAPGRMEIVTQEPYTIVDYAHSPDALENVLSTLQNVKKGRIIVVFGLWRR